METKEQSNARHARKKAAANELGELPAVVDPERRAKCMKDLGRFMRTYCMGTGGFLKSKPSKRMGEIIRHLQAVVVSGGRTHLRIARAHGKTSFVKGACLFALVYGYRRFIVAVSARKADASSMIDDLFTLCEDGETFAEDFPEVSVPIRRLGGIMQRAQNQTVNGKRTKIGKTADRIVLPTVDGSAASGAILVARGFKGAARGLVRGSMRPDLVLFDDLQDDKAAKNPRTVQAYDQVIEKNFLGLGGHDKQIAAMMTSTPICPDDLSELYAAKSNWKTFTFPMLISDPDCWGTKDDLWARYFDIKRIAIQDGEPEHIRANEFYRANRAAMDAGAEVLNPLFFDHATEVSGIQHAMNLRFANGEDSFSAEYQMKPVRSHEAITVSAREIAARVRKGTSAFHVPEGTVFTACATDLNPSYGYSTAVVCFDRSMTAFVTSYKVFTDPPLPIRDDMPETARVTAIYNALVVHGREVASWADAHGITIDRWGVDAGGKQFDAVMRFYREARNVCGIQCLPMLGRAGESWNPMVKSRISDERNGTVLCAEMAKGQRWLAFDADRAKETAQRAWLGEEGSPGGASLFDGKGARHGEFAAQIAAERLEYKVSLPNGRTRYKWRQVGRKHDYGDCMAMCYALAGAFGISAAGYTPPVRKRRRTQYVYKP